MTNMKNMKALKKMLVFVFSFILLIVCLLMTVSASSDPELMLCANYNEEEQTITVLYRVLDFAGVESADFRLKFNDSVVELAGYTEVEMSNVFIEADMVSDSTNTFAIQFIDLYCVEEDDCDEDGSATVMLLTFNVIDDEAENVSFIATCPDCYMDPDSTEIELARATLQISLSEGSTQASTAEGYDVSALISAFVGEEAQEEEDETTSDASDDNSDKFKSVIIAAVVTAVVLVAGIIGITVKYRRES